MSMQYIRDRYGVPAKRGARVEFEGQPGTIVASCRGQLRIRLDGEQHTRSYHPLWHLDYLDGIDHGKRYDRLMKQFVEHLKGIVNGI